MAPVTADGIARDIEAIRKRNPLVHNITNYVAMNSSANALLALGAAPVMAHAVEEVNDMTSLASALVINIGTLSAAWVDSMRLAMERASRSRIPVVFDPVGAGATPYRTRVSLELLAATPPTVIRGNASEIMALAGKGSQTKGVESVDRPENAARAAADLAKRYCCTVVVSGPVDLVTAQDRCVEIANGHPLMAKVTAMGCIASALVGAFCAVNSDALTAAAGAMATMGVAGELAAEKSAGPGSFYAHFLDSLWRLDRETIASRLNARQAATTDG